MPAANQVHQAEQVNALILAARVQRPRPLEASYRYREQFVAEFSEFDLAGAGAEPELMRMVGNFEPLAIAPSLDQVPRRADAIVVVEHALQQRGQGEHEGGRLAVGGADLAIALQAELGGDRSEGDCT